MLSLCCKDVWLLWNCLRSPKVPAGPSFPRSAAYLALAQGNGRELFGELHLFSKLVKVCSGVSAWGQHEHEGGGGTGVPEHDGEVSGLQQRQLVTVQGCASGLHLGTMHGTTSPNLISLVMLCFGRIRIRAVISFPFEAVCLW